MAERPAEQREVVDEALGNEPAVAVVEQVRLGVALAQLFVVLPHDIGQVAEARDVVGDADLDERVVERDLARGAREQVFAAQHVGDPHQRIVDRVHKGIEGCTIGAHNHKVGKRSLREGDLAANEVVEAELGVRHPKAQGRLASLSLVGGDRFGGQFPLEVVVALLGVPTVGDVAGLDLLAGGEALVEVPRRFELLNHTLVDVTALGLAVRSIRPTNIDALIPIDVQPPERIEELLVALLGVTRGVGVFDAEDQLASRVPGVGPVEQGRADQANVRRSRRRRAEADSDGVTGCGGKGSRHIA